MNLWFVYVLKIRKLFGCRLSTDVVQNCYQCRQCNAHLRMQRSSIIHFNITQENDLFCRRSISVLVKGFVSKHVDGKDGNTLQIMLIDARSLKSKHTRHERGSTGIVAQKCNNAPNSIMFYNQCCKIFVLINFV